MQHVFNTGCLYQPHGQIIAAKFIDNDRIVFVDYSRMIDGVIQSDLAKFERFPEGSRITTFERFVKTQYLNNAYLMPYEQGELIAVRELNKLCVEYLNNGKVS